MKRTSSISRIYLGSLKIIKYICNVKPYTKSFAGMLVMLFCLFASIANGQTSINSDCPNAIPLCQPTYSTTASYTDEGFIQNEINPGSSCLLSGERNDVWYTFTTPFFEINFTIIPNNPADDYDWAVYNLTSATCADIYTNPALEVSCNYAPNLGCGGTTGPNNNTGGACGGQNNPEIVTIPGQTYVINVSNFSSTQSGYTIDFSASQLPLNDVLPPTISFNSGLSCGSTGLNITFNENVTCASVQASDFVLTGPGGPYTVTSVSSASCNNLATDYGRIYTLSFSPALSLSGLYNLAVVSPINDLCGNSIAVPSNIGIGVAGVNIVKNQTNVTCPGDDDGTITLAATGAGPFTYQWTPNVSTTNTASNLAGGVYTITVTPTGTGCPAQVSVTVLENAPVALSNQIITPTSCASPSGSVALTPSGGVGPYTYQWDPSGGSGATASSLAAGNYTVTVTDSKGCDFSQTFAVPLNNNLLASISSLQNVKCKNGSDGAININVSGATGLVAYLWNTGATTANLSNIPTGTYSVTVTEGVCTSSIANLLIIEPATSVAAVPAVTATTCGNNNGTAALNATGGTGGFTYQWSPAGSGASSSNLAAGSYTVTVKDANLCTTTKNFNITASTAPVPAVVYTRQTVSCFGGSNGHATVNVAGGIAPYTYAWSGGVGSGNVKTNLVAGNYSVTVTDAAGCTAVTSVTINSPLQLLVLPVSKLNVKCFGQATGSATVNASGGTGLLAYQWSPAGGNASTANNLNAGTYTVTVTDANACTVNLTLNISQPASALQSTPAFTATSCGNSNGTAAANASGGTTPYTYAWSNGSTAASLNSLTFGSYTVTVTDGNLCMKTQTVNIAGSSAPVINNPVVQNLNCAGVPTGSISISAGSGQSPYSYTWVPAVSTSSSALSLSAGNYKVTVTDNSGCTVSGNYAVQSPASLLFANTVVTPVNCFGQNTGSIQTTATGGTGTLNFLWSNGSTTGTVNNLIAGSYSVTITDQNGCTSSQTLNVIQPAAALSAQLNVSNTTCGLTNGTISPVVTGGTSPYSYIWSTGATTSGINGQTSGGYTVTITDAKGCKQTKTTSILPSSAPVISNPVIQNLICAGQNTGSISISLSGGISPYSYQWSNNVSTGTVAGSLASGNYSVAVTDQAGCSITAAYLVTSPTAITIALNNKEEVDCYGNTSGSIDITASGGTGSLSYSWSNGSVSAVLSNLGAATYTVTVTDQNTCKKTQTYVIAQPAMALSNQVNNTATTCGLTNGTARCIPVGGTVPYKYLWSSGANTIQINNLASGTYTVTVSGDNGCLVNQTTQIQPSTAVTIATSNYTDALCNGSLTGSAGIVASGGITPYSYLWNNAQTTSQLNSISAGIYAVTVTDQAGCTVTSSITVAQPSALLVTMPATQTVCSGVATTLTPQVVGGTAPYQFVWSTGATQNTLTVTPTSSTPYSVTITDAQGCVKQSAISAVNVYPAISLQPLTNRSVCEGSTVSYAASATGGNNVYQYNWGAGWVTSSTLSQAYSSTTQINLTVRDGCNYTTTQAATVNVIPLPNVDFSADILAGCIPLSVNFTDKTVAVAGSDYLWDFGDGNTLNGVSDIANKFETAGIYSPTLTVTTPAPEYCAVTFTLADPINALNNPVADFSFAPEEPTILNPSVSFKNLSAFGNTYSWTFGDGGISSEVDPTHLYETIGNYTITLTSSNSYCEDTVVKILEVTDQYSLYIPKGFTPNGDGRNDEFTAYSSNITELQLNIYNRWGQKVFSAGQLPFSWNGNMNNTGSPLPAGAYIYSISAKDKFGNKHQYNGSVNLIR